MLEHKKLIIVASGGFDPLHAGHVTYLQKAKQLGGTLVVILNNDNWLRSKKGYVFMPEQERMAIVKALRCVDKVILTKHLSDTKDLSVCDAISEIKNLIRIDIFGKGGDRTADNIPEYTLCDKLSIKMVFGLGDKVQASSELVRRAIEELSQKKSV
ncbi:MAG: adenylyltransferase/cytidyltransferase family protein [Candidatus Woesearchaeota archaeon]|nr:adenylyltransferase/cytidyltransferase family protein [Candidatus Woesearchaeota archaeon]